MKPWMLMAVLACALAACDDDDGGPPAIDGGTLPDGDLTPDGGGEATFTSFVIDLVENRTADDIDAVTIDFGLPDPDLDVADAYAPLFP